MVGSAWAVNSRQIGHFRSANSTSVLSLLRDAGEHRADRGRLRGSGAGRELVGGAACVVAADGDQDSHHDRGARENAAELRQRAAPSRRLTGGVLLGFAGGFQLRLLFCSAAHTRTTR
jgi:hypothetical protein